MDRALSALRANTSGPLPKDMSKTTPDLTEEHLHAAPAGLSATTLAADMGVSR